MKLDEISQMIHSVADTIDEGIELKNNLKNSKDLAKKHWKYSRSDKFQRESIEAQRFYTKSARMLRVFVTIWIVLLITTVIICITGNDSLLLALGI